MTWQRGQSGNPSGRKRGESPRGAFRRQVEDAVPAIVARLVEAALGGDIAAAKVILDRVLAPLRATDEYVALKLPANAAERAEAVVRAVVSGDLTPDKAATLMSVLINAQVLAEYNELVQRLEIIEKWLRSRDCAQ